MKIKLNRNEDAKTVLGYQFNYLVRVQLKAKTITGLKTKNLCLTYAIYIEVKPKPLKR